MVSGTTWPDGDPFLQRQNEPSIAVSTRNSLHLLAGANDYRTVDLPGLPEGKETGDAWLGVFRSVDGGGSWKSTLVPGYPQDQTGGSPLHGYEAGADPVVRAGTHGLFYYSGIAFDRSLQRSAAFVARFMDLNNETVQPVRYIDTAVVNSFSSGGTFIDKPWLETDIPRAGAQSVTLNVPQGSGFVSQTVPCGNVYMAWAQITGQGPTLRTQIVFSRSTDCGGTWSAPLPISPAGTVGQGATIAVAPATGRVYVAWRQFRLATVDCVQGGLRYWKNNPGAWPVQSIVVGAVSYSKEQALAILNTDPEWDATYVLAQQLIPAKLNVLSGAANDPIEKAITRADALLVKFPLGSKPSSLQDQALIVLAAAPLLAFNLGHAGSPMCSAATTSYPDAVLVARSDDAGLSFSAPLQVAAVSPFDQGTTEYSFRTNAYPTIAADETGRAYLAWATRGLATPNGDSAAGDARIVVTTSKDGTTWTTPTAIDQPTLPGHQLFPSLTYNAGRLLLIYNDFRADASGVFEPYVVDLMDPSHPMRHTVDVRAAVAGPADAPVFTDYSLLNPSSQVSRYPFIVTGTTMSDAASLQLQYNPPNLPMFELGHAPFFGDYLDVAGAPRFVPNGDGTWSYNTAPSTAPVFQAVWTDNRDVVGPPDGDWTNYVPPGQGHTSLFDGSTPVPDCQTTSGAADRTQMRNQNIYTSRLMSGLFVGVPSNARPLSTDFQRAFVIFVQNATDSARQFQLLIVTQPAGGTASFQQFSLAPTRNVTIAAYSSVSQTVFVESSSPTASVDVQVSEVGACSATHTCLQSTVRINPDASNPPPADASLLTGEVYNPAVFNPAVYNPAVYNPAVLNPAVFNPAVFNPAVFNPAVFNDSVINYTVDNPAVFNPAVLNPAVLNPAVLNPVMANLALLNPAVFNPAVLNPAVLNPAVLNPAVFNPAVLNPAVLNPAVFNPAVLNPAVLNPGVFNPAVFNTAVSDGSVTEANYQVQNAGNATAAYSFNLNFNSNVPAGFSFQLMIYRLYFTPVANGCQLTEAAHQELLVNNLGPNLNANLLDPNGGSSFFLNPGDIGIATLRITPDPNAAAPGDPAHINLNGLSASVVSAVVNTAAVAVGDTQPAVAQILAPTLSPLVITSAALPGGTVGSPYSATLAATGGAGPRTWSAFGVLPLGLTLNTNGVLSGTPTTPGSFTFTIRVTDATQLAEQTVTVTVAAPTPPVAALAFTVQPANSTGGQPMPSVSVQALDATASPVPGASITMALGTMACSAATLSGSTTATTDATGVATFPGLAIDRGGWGYTLTASATGHPAVNATSNAFNVEGFCATGSLGTGRWLMPATLLPNGKVLVAGGAVNSTTATATAELFDPAGDSGVGSFAPTGSMSTPRYRHMATVLLDGRVLVTGGQATGPAALASAEIYDPAAATFTSTGSMSTGRALHGATLVPNGNVLITGGGDGVGNVSSSAELFDPAGNGGVGSFAPTGSMATARTTHTATPLLDGSVLVSGGQTTGGAITNSAEIYDFATGTFAPTGSMSTARNLHDSTRLPDGKVLITGGHDVSAWLASAELFDPATGTFTPTGPMGVARGHHTSTLLPNGKVLVSGGVNGGGPLDSAEIFDPAAGTFAPTGNMSAGRWDPGAALLLNGKVLIAGGYGTGGTNLSGAELFFPMPPTIFMVTNTADSGTGSLRQAILDANAHAGLDAIHFDIPGSGVQTISPASALPAITDPVLLDATTQPGYASTPLIRLDGASLSGAENGLEVLAGNSLLKGFMITRFPSQGIQAIHAIGLRLVGNFVGTDGNSALGNGVGGIRLSGCSGGLVDGNIVSANNGMGLALAQGLDLRASQDNYVANNKVGVDASGTVALGNSDIGVYIDTANYNTLRANVISGNDTGVWLVGSHHNRLAANRIGTSAAGSIALGNGGGAGIGMFDAQYNTLGGSSPEAANVISGNAEGVYLGGSSGDNVIVGNRIGTDASGAVAVANTGDGISLSDAGVTANRIESNVISGNTYYGISVWMGAHHNTVVSNRIGTNLLGEATLPNGAAGIIVAEGAHDNTIGGSSATDANVISGNSINGITLDGSSGPVNGTLIANNKVGTDAAGTAALGNAGDGIGIYNGASGNTVSGNVIAASSYNGIRLNSSGAGNVIRSNWVGTNAALAPGLGNGNQGISVAASAGTTIGGPAAGDRNVVAYNAEGGINLEGGATSTQILGNLVSGNTSAGVGVINSQSTVIAGNLIGTDVAGTAAWPNSAGGVFVSGPTTTTVTIGGTTPGSRNVISGNAGNGVAVIDGASLTTVVGNVIGTDAGGTIAVPNTLSGIEIVGSNNLVGDSNPPYAAGNIIAFNGAYGIQVVSGSSNDIVSNRIFRNGSLGIYLGAGANNDLEAPVITSATDDGTNTTVTGAVNVGVAGATAFLQFFANDACDSSGYGQGQSLVGTTSLVAGGDGTASFSANLPTGLVGKAITATTSTLLGPGGSTSAFSACVVATRILWAHQFMIGANDSVTAVAAEGLAVYVAGTSTGVLPGQPFNSYLGIFVRKYDLAGNELWTRQFSSMSGLGDHVTAISVDASGVYVVGYLFGDLPGFTDAGYFDAFVRKYDLDGNELWTRQFGTANNDSATGVAVDSSGVYVAGWTQGSLPGQANLGGSDAFVRKYDLAGNEVWIHQFGTTSDDHAYAISVDASGVYVTGDTTGAFPGLSNSGGVDTFVRKYDADGNELWTRQFGSAGDDYARALSVDASGVYVTGYTASALPGQSSSGGVDAFVRKYDSNGNELWTRQFGTTSDDHAYAISVDASGVYVAGYTAGAFPGQASSGGVDAFVRLYDFNGNELWTRQFGTASDDNAFAISVGPSGLFVGGQTDGTLPGQTNSAGTDAFVRRLDVAGNEVWTRQFGGGASQVSTDGMSVDTTGVYVSGYTAGVFPGQADPGVSAAFVHKVDLAGNDVWTALVEPNGIGYGLFNDGSNLYVTGQVFNYPGLSGSGDYDVFVDKLDLAGNSLWSSQFGTTGNDVGDGIVADESGEYVSGRVQGTLPGQTSSGTYDAFVRKVDAAGNEIWTRQFGTSGWDSARWIAIDSSGVYVTGGTDGAFPGETNSGSRDVYVRKYDLDGNELWTRQFGTAGFDYGWRIAVDASGVYVVGEIDAGALPGETSAGGIDAFVRKYDLNGNLLWTHQFGSAGDDVAYGVAVDASGVYVAGYTTGTLPGQTSSGGMDVFVRKYDLNGNLLWTCQFGSAGDESGSLLSVDDSGVYVSGVTDGALPGQKSTGGWDAYIVKLSKW